MKDLFAKIRPQILIAIVVLGLIAGYSIRIGAFEIAATATTGIVLLGREILNDKD
jgi:uncharacterized membrane protein